MWLILPTSRSSPESEDSISPSDLRFLGLSQSATSRTTSRSAAFWRREWKKGRLNPFRSGLTCEPSLANSIVAEWLASSGASPAPTSASPANEPESTPAKPADCGGSTSESSGKSNQSGFSSKTSPDSSAHPVAIWNPETQLMESPQIGLFATSTPFLGRWPTSGSMRNGCVFERPTWAPPSSASGCSFWPTADVDLAQRGDRTQFYDGRRGQDLMSVAVNWNTPGLDSFRSRGGDCIGEMGLDQEARKWTTPQGHDCRGTKTPKQISAMKERTGAGVHNLNEETASWSTPRSEDAESCGNHPKAQDSLTGQTRNWLTPHGNENPNSGAGGGEFAKDVQQWRSPNERDHHAQGPRLDALQRQTTLTDQAQNWSTPSARDWKSGEASDETLQANARPLSEEATHWSTPTSHDGRRPGGETGSTQGRNLKREGQRYSLPVQAWVERACSMTYESFTPEALAELGSAIKPNSATPSNGSASSMQNRGSRPRLNPAFDAFHMGFPWWWTRTAPTSFAPAEMRWWLCRAHWRLQSFLGDLGHDG